MKKCSYAALLILLIFGITAPAWAASTLFTLTGGGTPSGGGTVLTYTGGGFTLTLTGYTCMNQVNGQLQGVSLCNSVDTGTYNTKETIVKNSTYGLGLANDIEYGVGEIPRDEFIQVDFSTVPANTTISSITFTFTDLVDGWDIYQSSVPGEFDSGGGGPVAQGNNGGASKLTFPNIASTIDPGGLSGSSTVFTSSAGNFNVTALQSDCEAALSSITVNYGASTPEPGTCLLMGMALLGLGAARRKRRSRS